MRDDFLYAVRYMVIIFVILFVISGCGRRYLSEKLYWQANQEIKEIVQGRTLDKLSRPEYQKIITAYRRVVDKCPLEPLAAQSQFIIAQLYVLQGAYSQSEEELLKVIRNFSTAPEIAARAQFMIGNLYERQGDWERAVAEYEKIINLYPLSDIGLKTPIYIAQHYQKINDDTQAEQAYQQAERNYQKLIDDYTGTSIAPVVTDYLALNYFNQGDWDKAIEAWQGIASEYSQSPVAARSLLASGEIYAKQIKDLQKAIKTYEDFVKQYPDSQVIKQVKFQIGKLYLNNNDTEKAKQTYREIIKDYPEETDLCANVHLALAACYEKEGNSNKALEEYQKIRESYSDTKLALGVPFFIARHYLISEADSNKVEAAFAEAINEYEDIIQQGRSDAFSMEAVRLISLCYIQQKKWDEAVRHLYNFTIKFPDKPEVQTFLFNIASIYESQLNQPEKAKQVYEEIINKYPTNNFLVNLAKSKLSELDSVN